MLFTNAFQLVFSCFSAAFQLLFRCLPMLICTARIRKHLKSISNNLNTSWKPAENHLDHLIAFESIYGYLKSIWKASEKQLKSSWKAAEKQLKSSWKPFGPFDSIWKHLRIIWKASKNHLKSSWNNFKNRRNQADKIFDPFWPIVGDRNSRTGNCTRMRFAAKWAPYQPLCRCMHNIKKIIFTSWEQLERARSVWHVLSHFLAYNSRMDPLFCS